MAETLGSFYDTLTTVKLKQRHSEVPERLLDLAGQRQFQEQADRLTSDVTLRPLPPARLDFRRQQGLP